VLGRRADLLVCWRHKLGRLLAPPLRFRGQSELELHTLIGHDAVPLYLLAVRSFHRHLPDARVVVHDDGTLSRLDRLILRAAVRGAKLIPARTADRLVEERLRPWPALLRARRDNVRLRQLIDYSVLAASDCVVGVDADAVLLREPAAVLAWAAAAGPKPSLLYSPERDPKGPHWVPELLPGTPYVPDLCCGFVCLQPSRFFDPAALERLLGRVPEEVLARRRFVTQMLYSLMAARPGQSAHSLGPLYESGRLRWLPEEPARVLCHYFSSHERSGAAQSLLEERELFARVAG
jgi:hypothetical protein